MIYPTLGISMIAHMAIVAAGKAGSIFGFKKPLAQIVKRMSKKRIADKVLISLFVAFIIELVLVLVVGSAGAAIYFGATGEKSNLNVLKNLYTTEIRNTKTVK